MSIIRKRSGQHKVYIPSTARENQYLLAKINVTDELLAQYADIIDPASEQPYQKFYQTLAELFFQINNDLGIESGQFVANDKFTRIRFSPEKVTSQTEQQILFLYNPRYHRNQNAYFDGSKLARKLTLVFLATGDDIRFNAAKFHQKVKQAITVFSEKSALQKSKIRVRDHQHLTYDLFAKHKGVTGTQAHKLRSMTKRYLADEQTLPEPLDALTYAVVDLHINSRIKQLVELDKSSADPYNPLYNLIADAFISAAKSHHLNNGAVIANGLVPIVRSSDNETTFAKGELQMLGYNPQHTGCGYTCKWAADKLVDTVHLIFVASEQDKTDQGYARFLSQIEHALQAMAEQLGYVYEKEEMMVRFHQHIGFYL